MEIRNPRPQVHKTKETRHTTIRYPVFITQVIKPLLTQVETKVKPMFFTKTLKRIKTIVFTVTGIGQVTVTSVKYEKEYVTRCHKKPSYGGGHKGVSSHKEFYRRRSDGDAVEEDKFLEPEPILPATYATESLSDYGDVYATSSNSRRGSSGDRQRREVRLAPSIAELPAGDVTAVWEETRPISAVSAA